MISPMSCCSTVRNHARRGKRRFVLLIESDLANIGGAQGKTPSLPETTSQLAVSLLATHRRKEPSRESAEKAVSTRDSSMASPWCASPRLASAGLGGFLCGWGLEDRRQAAAATRGARRWRSRRKEKSPAASRSRPPVRVSTIPTAEARKGSVATLTPQSLAPRRRQSHLEHEDETPTTL